MHSTLRQPLGVVPLLEGCELPGQYAQLAENMDLTQRGWVPWFQPVELLQFDAPVGTAHVHNCCWDSTPIEEARYVYAGTCQKTYLSAANECPVVSDDFCSAQWTRLGYPIPSAPVVCNLESDDVEREPFTETVSYKIVYATECEQGPGSMPSEPLKMREKGTAVISIPKPAPEWGVTHARIYRLMTTWDVEKGLTNFDGDLNPGIAAIDTEADYFLVGEVPITEDEFVDNYTEMGTLLTSDDFFPPVPGLEIVGETILGSLVGFEGNNVWFSERNAYWAFPLRARHNFPEPVMCVAVCQSTVIVVTQSRVYTVEDNADCRDSTCRPVVESKVSFQYCGTGQCIALSTGVIYTAEDGLMYADTEGRVQVISDRAFQKKQWGLLGPSSIRLGTGCGHLFLSTDQVSYAWPLLFDEQGKLPEYISTLSFRVDQWLNDEHDHLYFVVDGKGYQFNGGTEYMAMHWQQVDQRRNLNSKVSAYRADYLDKNLRVGNTMSLFKKGQFFSCTTQGNKSVRTRNTVADCHSIAIQGNKPVCGLHYGPGITNLTVETTR